MSVPFRSLRIFSTEAGITLNHREAIRANGCGRAILRSKAAAAGRRSILVIYITGGALSILPIDRENVSLLLYYYKKSANLPLVARPCLFHSRSISVS
jgi:hypothetical protein